jgi:hypothetical protein
MTDTTPEKPGSSEGDTDNQTAVAAMTGEAQK